MPPFYTSILQTAERSMAERQFVKAERAFKKASNKAIECNHGTQAVYCVTQSACCGLVSGFSCLVSPHRRHEMERACMGEIEKVCRQEKVFIKERHKFFLLAQAYSRVERFLRQEGYFQEAAQAHLKSGTYRCYFHFFSACAGPFSEFDVRSRVSSVLCGLGCLLILLTSGFGERPLRWVLSTTIVSLYFFARYYCSQEWWNLNLSWFEAARLSAGSLTLSNLHGYQADVTSALATPIMIEGIIGYFLMALLVSMIFRLILPN